MPSPTFGLALETSSSMRSAGSMQTPPPTSTSASRRKAQQAQVAKLVQQSAAAGKRMSVPLFPQTGTGESSAMQAEASPQQFSALQFSPDVFEFSMSGPATAPIFPQQKLFWEPKHDEGMNIDFSGDLTNPFDTPRLPPLDPFVSVHDHSAVPQGMISSSLQNYSGEGSKTASRTNPSSSFAQIGFVSTAGPIGEHHIFTRTGASGVDPSLLFSSPGRSLEPLDTSMTSTTVLDEDTLQPYAYQIQEAKREKAAEGSAKPNKKKRKPDSDSPAVKAALETLRGDDAGRPKVHRRITDTVVLRTNKETRPAAPLLFKETNGPEPSRRRVSPIKNSHSNTHPTEAHGPRRRTALALTIDSSGRARTETRVIIDEPGSAQTEENSVDLDRHSDSSDSDRSSNSSLAAMITSQAPSFDFPREESKGPRMSRFPQNAVSHSSKSSYASIHTSSTYGENWQPTMSTKPTTTKSTSSFGQQGGRAIHDLSRAPISYGHVGSIGTEDSVSEAETIMESDEGDGSAQHELRKVLRDQEITRKSTPDYSNKPKHLPSTLRKQDPTSHRSKGTSSIRRKGNTSNLSGISPTTISDPDLPTPSSAGGSNTSENIRCICHNTMNDGQMIVWYGLPCLKAKPQSLTSA